MAIQEVITSLEIIYQKISGSCVSEGVKAIRHELVSSSFLKPEPFFDMRALHNEAMIAEEEAL